MIYITAVDDNVEGREITWIVIIRSPPGLLLGENMKWALARAGLPVELSSARGCCLFLVMRLDDLGDDVDIGDTCDD